MNWEEFNDLYWKAIDAPIPEYLKTFPKEDNKVQPYYKLIRQIAMAETKPGVILEIGTFYGTSAAFFCSGLDWTMGHRFVGIDLNPPIYQNPFYFQFQGDSADENIYQHVRQLSESLGGIFLVHQDSSHTYEQSKKEWELYAPLVRPGGVWLADDITESFKGMTEYWDEISYPGMGEDKKRISSELHIGSKQGIILF